MECLVEGDDVPVDAVDVAEEAQLEALPGLDEVGAGQLDPVTGLQLTGLVEGDLPGAAVGARQHAVLHGPHPALLAQDVIVRLLTEHGVVVEHDPVHVVGDLESARQAVDAGGDAHRDPGTFRVAQRLLEGGRVVRAGVTDGPVGPDRDEALPAGGVRLDDRLVVDGVAEIGVVDDGELRAHPHPALVLHCDVDDELMAAGTDLGGIEGHGVRRDALPVARPFEVRVVQVEPRGLDALLGGDPDGRRRVDQGVVERLRLTGGGPDIGDQAVGGGAGRLLAAPVLAAPDRAAPDRAAIITTVTALRAVAATGCVPCTVVLDDHVELRGQLRTSTVLELELDGQLVVTGSELVRVQRHGERGEALAAVVGLLEQRVIEVEPCRLDRRVRGDAHRDLTPEDGAIQVSRTAVGVGLIREERERLGGGTLRRTRDEQRRETECDGERDERRPPRRTTTVGD